MILKGFIVILVVFNLKIDITTSRNVFNLDEINSITKYIENIELKTFNDYHINSVLSNGTNYDVLKKIFNDGINVLSDFEEVSTNSNFDEFDSKWNDLIKQLSSYATSFNHSSEAYALLNINFRIQNFFEKIGILSETFKYITENDSNDMDFICRGIFKTSKYILDHINYEQYTSEYVGIFKTIKEISDSLLINNKKLAKFNNCGKFTSFRQVLFNYHKRMIFAQVKYSIINYYMWIIEQQCENATYESNTNKARTYSMELQDTINLTVETLYGINYYAYQCRPTLHQRSSENNYIELERMMQTMIVDEKKLTLSQSCNNECDFEKLSHSTQNETECREFLDCKRIDSSYDVCLMDNHVRRYSWFEDSYGHTYGKKSDICNGHMTLLSDYIDGLYLDLCTICVCTCLSKPKRIANVITSISFRDQKSDINNNKIVTGVRFLKKDYMIHVQILEAEVLPHGKTNSSLWKPIENFDYNETTENYYVINEDKSLNELHLGTDYGHPEIMNLNDVMCPKGEVVTGVRFRFVGDSLDRASLTGGPIELQIQTTPFDFIQGKLVNISETRWLIPENQSIKDELLLKNPEDPRNSPEIDFVLTTNKFVKFRASDIKKDAGQTTVPILDSREVVFDGGFPLGGVGLFHLGHQESGGYLAFRVFDFNMF